MFDLIKFIYLIGRLHWQLVKLHIPWLVLDQPNMFILEEITFVEYSINGMKTCAYASL